MTNRINPEPPTARDRSVGKILPIVGPTYGFDAALAKSLCLLVKLIFILVNKDLYKLKSLQVSQRTRIVDVVDITQKDAFAVMAMYRGPRQPQTA